ncbi:MAG TPA: phosphoribosylformylglycinamidine synthase subunit PurS [Tepidiformaceae bacterium]|nr:phosphoribosylformylglycinamidine synthase subunit PurS [Tepidiformaceae bacterium]
MSKAKDRKKDGKEAAPKGDGVYLARVYVSLKPTVNDPEGATIGGALASLGFGGVVGVRSGRYFQVTLNAADPRDAAAQVDQMCARLLANPVIETYSFDLDKAGKK